LIDKLKFENIRGPERGRLIKEVRSALESTFKGLEELSADIFRKRLDRIIWELASVVPFEAIVDSIKWTKQEAGTAPEKFEAVP
jgi:hypothetical protein